MRKKSAERGDVSFSRVELEKLSYSLMKIRDGIDGCLGLVNYKLSKGQAVGGSEIQYNEKVVYVEFKNKMKKIVVRTDLNFLCFAKKVMDLFKNLPRNTKLGYKVSEKTNRYEFLTEETYCLGIPGRVRIIEELGMKSEVDDLFGEEKIGGDELNISSISSIKGSLNQFRTKMEVSPIQSFLKESSLIQGEERKKNASNLKGKKEKMGLSEVEKSGIFRAKVNWENRSYGRKGRPKTVRKANCLPNCYPFLN